MNIGKKQKIFIGSKNKGKISDWKRYFVNLDILDPYMIDEFIEVSESSDSIFENAKKKSLEWGSLTDVITVSDDTGFLFLV